MGGEFPEETVGADVAGVVLEGGAIGQAGQKITDRPAHPLLFDAQGSPIRDQMRMKMIKFEETLEDLAGALVDVPDSGVVVQVLMEKRAQILDFDAHRKGEGDEAAGEGLRIGGGGGLGLRQQGVGGAGGILHQEVGQAACDVSAGAFRIKPGVVFTDGGFGFFPELDMEQGGGIDQTAFEGILQVVAGVGDFVREIDDLGFE